ncbi:hypothetical protein I316_05824 [Kwoniella heveanensis BCC8398]|uniref:Uncharacterized protein n=1 Tax=Kwoniella heveanensis BCC8398 TaxID=1296120 RepID=A0A1B9GMT2_9TREE|nr:hypothetical protein I316_05824 [Kwoniella heveanensis BCC8398]
MPTDPIAYMSGMIPSVSRGGSWVPGNPHFNARSQAHSSFGYPISHSARSSPALPTPMPLTPPAPMSSGLSPMVPISGHASAAGGVGLHQSYGLVAGESVKSGSGLGGPGPVLHQGWLRAGSEISGSAESLHDERPLSPLAVPDEIRSRSYSRRQPSTASSYYRSQPDLDQPQQPSPYRKLSRHEVSRDREDDHHGAGSTSSASSSCPRPGLARRHTHAHTAQAAILSPKPRRGAGVDLQRSAQLNCRMARLSLHGRGCHTPDPDPSPSPSPMKGPSLSHALLPSNGESVGEGDKSISTSSGRPQPIERRHSSGFSKTRDAPPTPSSLPHGQSHKHGQSAHRAASQLQLPRVRHLSTPHPSPLVPLPSPSTSPSRHTPVHDHEKKNKSHTSPPGSSIRSEILHDRVPTSSCAGGKSKPFPRSHGGSASKRYPHSRNGWDTPTPRSRSGSYSRYDYSPSDTPRRYTATSQGYIPPLSDDEYDRYQAHPAPPPGPGSGTFESRSSPHSPTTSSLAPSTGPDHNTPPLGADVMPAPPKEYIPPAFPKPTRDVAWNRTGPAMKTHGIAWLREGEVGELPQAPKGPRYIVARPPRAETISGGNWWSSGGEGTGA